MATSLNKSSTITTNTLAEDLQKPDTADLALEEIQTEKFYNTLKSYYSYREADNKFMNMSHADLLDYFYTDRSWRNNNTVSMGMDFANVFGEDAGEVFQKHYALGQLLSSLDAEQVNEINQVIGNFIINQDGTVTITE